MTATTAGADPIHAAARAAASRVSSSAAAARSAAAASPREAGQPGLGPPGDRRLGQHQDHRRRPHRSARRGSGPSPSARRMSATACSVPRTEPVTLERVPAAAAVVGDVPLDHPPAGGGRAQQQLQRVAEAAVPDVEGQQGVPVRHPHRCDVVHRQARGGAPAGRASGWPAGRATARPRAAPAGDDPRRGRRRRDQRDQGGQLLPGPACRRRPGRRPVRCRRPVGRRAPRSRTPPPAPRRRRPPARGPPRRCRRWTRCRPRSRGTPAASGPAPRAARPTRRGTGGRPAPDPCPDLHATGPITEGVGSLRRCDGSCPAHPPPHRRVARWPGGSTAGSR